RPGGRALEETRHRPRPGRPRIVGAPPWPVLDATPGASSTPPNSSPRYVSAVFTPPAPPTDVLGPADEDARVAALDRYLLALGPTADPQAERAIALADLVRTDRTVRRVDGLARAEGLSPRSLQRLFASYVGVGPKWVILRYRIHEALERAESDPQVDWAALAAELGYSDQAHLIRDFTATVGVPPTAFAPR
ncbi:helix-turn-helix domain-containing protein, partial [Streptomyces sanglieri]|uniref:helix-turn-helix domain-containing protein n=1 Tax=Streptomyces sanglieri TaxID=193460 RepID=UPI0035255699